MEVLPVIIGSITGAVIVQLIAHFLPKKTPPEGNGGTITVTVCKVSNTFDAYEREAVISREEFKRTKEEEGMKAMTEYLKEEDKFEILWHETRNSLTCEVRLRVLDPE